MMVWLLMETDLLPITADAVWVKSGATFPDDGSFSIINMEVRMRIIQTVKK